MCVSFMFCIVFFFKQKTAYEMRIIDWSSDVCSSDLKDKSLPLPGKGEGFIFLVAGISLVAVMLGVAALIIVMSVMNGFRAELFDKIVGQIGRASCRERVCQYV